jgi:hypothetical protein
MPLQYLTTAPLDTFTILAGRQMMLQAIKGTDPLWTFTAPGYDFTKHLPPTITLLVKNSPDASDAAAFATCAGTISDPTNGKFNVQLTTAATAAPGRFFYKLLMTDNASHLWLSGDFVVMSA